MERLPLWILALSLSAATLASADAIAKPSEFGGLTFHSSVPKWQSALLKEDLSFLYALQLETRRQHPLKSLMGLEEVSGRSLHNWVLNRARFVVSNTYRFEATPLRDLGFHTYEFPREMPQILANQGNKAVTSDGQQVLTAMSNVGVEVYLTGKKMGRLYGVDFDGRELAVTSPRIGLIQIGNGLFNLDRKKRLGEKNSDGARLLRLSTLIHESRHSDGRGESVGFLHSVCPKGHRYQDLSACDAAPNGPYAIEAAFLLASLKSCADCTPERKEILRAAAADYLSRVIGSSSSGRGDLLTRAAVLKRQIKSLRKNLSRFEGTVRENARVELQQLETQFARLRLEIETDQKSLPQFDATPEGTFKTIDLKTSSATLRGQP